jgi:hypothetical protein
MDLPEKYEASFHSLLRQVNPNDSGRFAELKEQLAGIINFLITHHFERLVHLLYTIDVDERQLKEALHHHKDKDAAVVMAELVLQRQLQKVVARGSFYSDPGNIPEEERW